MGLDSQTISLSPTTYRFAEGAVIGPQPAGRGGQHGQTGAFTQTQDASHWWVVHPTGAGTPDATSGTPTVAKAAAGTKKRAHCARRQ
jgi:hypothetical protein